VTASTTHVAPSNTISTDFIVWLIFANPRDIVVHITADFRKYSTRNSITTGTLQFVVKAQPLSKAILCTLFNAIITQAVP
jgi:hypothetical protein